MSTKNDSQAAFMEAINGLKEYARVNGGIVTKEDVCSYFKEMDMNDARLQMVYGYLMANNIQIQGEDIRDNEFLRMMEQADSGADTQENVSEQEQQVNETVKQIEDALDYTEDEKYLRLYMQDLQTLAAMSDTTRAFLLMNIAEDNDQESLKLLSESFLEKIVSWVEPYRRKGVLASDLVQEGNLAMMAYISEKRFLNNYEWKDKIKEGSTQELLEVLSGIEKQVKSEVEECLMMLLDEQKAANEISGKVLGKVNLVNDWAKRLKEELGRKPTVDELAEKMGISRENIMEAIQLSAENIEDVDCKEEKDKA